jgi:indolepyruvate ferredoxin oxidoreductase alpha subunit
LAGDGGDLAIIANGVAVAHAREAAPEARVLALGVGYPLPLERIRAFARRAKRCVVVEEGDPLVAASLLAAGIAVEGPPERYRFGELDVGRVRRLLARDDTEEAPPPPGKPPQLCPGCPHRIVFEALRQLDCIVSGDIGCYTLGVLPPFQAMDSCVCMGASIGVGLGLRHVLPEKDARRVVSVIGDSTFVHSGMTGLAEMAYNPPPTGHLVLLLDNGTTAMTGLQEHPGTGHNLKREPAGRVDYEAVARAVGVTDVETIDTPNDAAAVADIIGRRLAAGKLSFVILRRPCILAAKHLRDRATC